MSWERCESFHWQYRCEKAAGHHDGHRTTGDDGSVYEWPQVKATTAKAVRTAAISFIGQLRFSFNRAGAAPNVWSIATDACELAVRSVTFRGVDVRTVYAPKPTADDEDGKPSAWMECAGTVTVFSDGHAEVTG